MPHLTLAEIANRLGCEYSGDGASVITGAATIENASAQHITFLDNPKYKKFLSTCQAGAIVLKDKFAEESPIPCLVTAEPYVAFAKILNWLAPLPTAKPGVHASAVIDPTAQVAADVEIAANVTICAAAKIGAGTIIGPGTVVGENVSIGEHCHLQANVTIYRDVEIGNRVQIHSGAVIGADGFGFANEQGTWLRVPQIGRVIIGDDVDIGANACIDRGAIDDTIINRNVKIDNLVQIAHNVNVGEGTAIAGCTGVAGSTKIGKYNMIAGGCGILGHITFADHVMLAAGTQVGQDLEPGIYASNLPSLPISQWRRMQVHVRNIDQVVKRVAKLEKALAGEDA